MKSVLTSVLPMVAGVLLIINACLVLTSVWMVNDVCHHVPQCLTSTSPVPARVPDVIPSVTDAPTRSLSSLLPATFSIFLCLLLVRPSLPKVNMWELFGAGLHTSLVGSPTCHTNSGVRGLLCLSFFNYNFKPRFCRKRSRFSSCSCLCLYVCLFVCLSVWSVWSVCLSVVSDVDSVVDCGSFSRILCR